MSDAVLRQLFLGWTAALSFGMFVLFGVDKRRAGRGGRRLAESTLFWASALGGWPGGLLGMVLFRHKSAKPSFALKFAGAFLIWAGLGGAALYLSAS